MRTADKLPNDELIEQLKLWTERKNVAYKAWRELDDEFKRRLNYTEIMEGQVELEYKGGSADV